MKAFELESAVKKVAEEKGIDIFGSQEDSIREAKDKLKSGEFTTFNQVKDELKKNKEFRLKFSREDFENIEHAIR